jgi:HD-GYP domain-containing protein (c-di-GMP phosphodiesterase class II)
MRPPHSVHVLTAGIFTLLTLLVGGSIGLMAYLQQRDLLLENASLTLERTLQHIHSSPHIPNERIGTTAQRRLTDIAALLWWNRNAHATQIAILDAAGGVLAASHGNPSGSGKSSRRATLDSIGLPVLARIAALNFEGKTTVSDIDGHRWLALRQSFDLAPGQVAQTVIAVPWEAIFSGAYRPLWWTLLICLGLAVPTIWLVARHLTLSLRQLAGTATEIHKFHLEGDAIPRSPIKEIDTLGQTLSQLRTTLRHFLEISQRMAAELDHDKLLDQIVTEAIGAAHAQAGAVFLLESDRELRPMAWRHISNPAPSPPESIDTMIETLFATSLQCSKPQQLAFASIHLPLGLRWLGGWFPGHAMQVLMVPLSNRSGTRLGLLLLARGYESGPYDEELVAFINALSGTMAAAIETQQLLDGRKALLDGVVRMIAGAIDARSPHTGAHCQRVPLLAGLLADAIASHPDSPYRNSAWNEASRESLYLAAWLHDCGKLFVPDYITDKSVKLEAIHNRIHEIRTRFEVLKRDAEIACWRAIAADGEASALLAQLEVRWAELDEEFAFVARCNLGDHPLSDADAAKLARIGERTWLRTLDDRLGISAEELQRKTRVPPRPLPAQEHLLSDRLEHLIGDHPTPSTRKTAAAKTTLHRPRHRLNLGELYCLSVRAGTLTPEERYLINAHILGTISMLSTLPLPMELACVPEIAGSHHEHLDGSGYPFGRQAEELSLAARIIAIADVFEALTAADRPYKASKTTAEALAIMADMARRHHLDADLLELFIKADIPAQLHQTVTKSSPSPA